MSGYNAYHFPFRLSRRNRALVASTLVLSLSGCSLYRVDLEVPAADAPFEVRQKAYERLAPTAEIETVQEGAKGGNTIQLELGDGTLVTFPGDLEPAVLPDSPTAKAIKDVKYHTKRTRKMGWFSLGSGVLGIGVGAIGIPMTDPEPKKGIPFFVAGGVLILTGLSLGIVSALRDRERIKATRRAYRHYGDDLLERLNLEAKRVKFKDARLRDQEASKEKTEHNGLLQLR